MTEQELTMSRKAESIYTTTKRNRTIYEKKAALAKRSHTGSFKRCIRDMALPNLCYVYINGISMPVSRA